MPRFSRRRSLLIGVLCGGALAASTSFASVAVAAYFARRVVTPERERRDDARILSVERDNHGTPTAVVLAATAESQAPGRYGLFWDEERAHARIGDVLGHTPSGGVVRRVDGVTRGDLTPGPARWSGYYVDGSPQEAFGIPTQEINLPTECGPAPTWVTRSGDGRRWAVLVHGRGARRGETLRAVPVLHELGISCVIPSYRNDVDGPASLDGRYGLGLTEWRDVETACEFALERGAQNVDLFGWSMGGAIAMQFLARSPLASSVGRVVFDGPVLDWGDVLVHQARSNRMHPRLASLAAHLLGHRSSRRTIGLDQAVDIKLTDWVERSHELTHPILVIHSVDDDVVPYGPTAAVAAARPDLVRWERWEKARHVREWNTDPARWEQVVRDFLS